MPMRSTCAAFVVVVTVVLTAGCAATVKRGDSVGASPLALRTSTAARLVLNVSGSPESLRASDWEGFKQEWRENSAEQARVYNVQFAMQEGPATPTGQEGTLLAVYVQDYRFLRPGTRYAVGIMSGNAYIESLLTYRDLKSGTVIGTQPANTSSSAWEGVFSPMTNKQVEAIAADVYTQMGAVKR